MANIPLKSIKFPDLDDTYTVPSNAGELPYNKSATYPDDTVGKALQNIGDSSAPAIIETATGSIASFTDGANVPVKDLVAEIVPLQSGSGDPSPDNVRPITGWTKAEIHVADGENPHIVDNVKTINWQSQAGTVYGGSIDVTTGVLTVDRAIRVFTDADTFTLSNSYANRFYLTDAYSASKKAKTGGVGESSHYIFQKNVAQTSDLTTDKTIAVYQQNNPVVEFYIHDSSFATANELNSYIASQYSNGTPIQLVYELATPQTYQLTPTEVKSLLKNNNIWADTGDVTVEYVADTKTFIENLVNA